MNESDFALEDPMSRFPRTLSLILTLGLFLAACGPQTADRRPQADGGQPSTPSPVPTLTPTPTPTPTPTEIPRPSLESLGLSAETRAVLTRQGWLITWDAQNARYLIRQRAWDETNQKFTPQLTHEIGFIDAEGRLHFTATQYSASENEDGTWKDTSTTQAIVVDLKNLPQNPYIIIRQQLDENGNPIPFQKKLKNPGFHLLKTKNPAFEKTGILSFTAEINGAPLTFVYNRELGFLQMPELSTDLVHPTPLPIEAVHSLAALQFVLLQYGDGEPFPIENFPGWSLQFYYYPENDTKQAILWPRSGETAKYILFLKENKVFLAIPWFMIVLPDGKAYPSAPVEIFNPKDPQNPKDGNEKLILFPAFFLGEMTARQRYLFSLQYLTPTQFSALFKQRVLILAQEGGLFTKASIGGWSNFFKNPASLDSLLGMEGNDIRKMDQIEGYAHLPSALTYICRIS